ncbi:ABC transporter substrate-binding protein [Rhodobacteraceae bacterium 2376]|uniref:ABC transporter substrate-binding protein n=1 Tax=Rhabdonatronobacter sediminivivens TaxID=2743469 RepID=A0A7Z0HWR1_9RHOB|nr:ABC transporter substrate-binding protein [Rhabdonatronobacter sediminivivens]NYS23741.1 ABC transporter substrate-binding protein [Rhabdonatronobacter sediminivivens]
MKMTRLTAALAVTMTAAAPAIAESLFFPNMSYRTGPFAAGGIPFADGYADYFTLINERDGGIGGVPIRYSECETAYNTERGVECYQALRGENPLVLQPLSTGITYQIIPRAARDEIPIHSMGYGRTSAVNGEVFNWTFNYPANYWDGASVIINYLLDENEGSLDDKKIVLLYHNSAYGREPIPTLTRLSERLGYELLTIGVDSPGQEQGSQWLQIRRERPDYVIMWGWGVMNSTAVQEAANIRFPMENFIGVWWSGSQQDVLPAGMGADGYKALAMHGTGTDYPVYDDLQEYVYDRGLAAGTGDEVGTVLYSRGMYAAMLAVEAARTAQEIHGVANITPAMMRDGMANLVITEERMAELGLPDFGPPFEVSCQNHGGSGQAMIQQWDASAQEWNLITDWIEPDRELIMEMVMEDSLAFAAENDIEPACLN